MGIALYSLSALSSALHALARWLVHLPEHHAASAPTGMPPRPSGPSQPVHPQGGLPRQTRVVRGPVRVVRVLDGGTPGGSGRLVIAGRMADVCAELDRLALREQACH